MKITHNTTAGETRTILQSEYDPTTHSLTRILNSHIYTIYMKPSQTQITDLQRFTSLPNDLFIDLAYLQRRHP